MSSLLLMSVLPSIRQILTILATETGVERYRAGDTTERALVLRYKDSRPACPEILQVRIRNIILVDEPVEATFARAKCNARQSLAELRQQRDRFLRCAILRDWSRRRVNVT